MEDLKTSDFSGVRAWLHKNQCSEKKMQLFVQRKPTEPLQKSNKNLLPSMALTEYLEKET